MPKGYSLLLSCCTAQQMLVFLLCSHRESGLWQPFQSYLEKQFYRISLETISQTLTVRIALYRSFLFLSSSHHSFLYLPKEYFNISFHHIYLLSRGHCFKPHSPKYHQQKATQRKLLKMFMEQHPSLSYYTSKLSDILTHCREYLTWT